MAATYHFRAIASDGNRVRPLMIHHAIFGSLGRMIAILLEHHGGVLRRQQERFLRLVIPFLNIDPMSHFFPPRRQHGSSGEFSSRC